MAALLQPEANCSMAARCEALRALRLLVSSRLEEQQQVSWHGRFSHWPCAVTMHCAS
jgi:hypothetical protein